MNHLGNIVHINSRDTDVIVFALEFDNKKSKSTHLSALDTERTATAKIAYTHWR